MAGHQPCTGSARAALWVVADSCLQTDQGVLCLEACDAAVPDVNRATEKESTGQGSTKGLRANLLPTA